MMFGYTLIKTKDLHRLEQSENRLHNIAREFWWFSGFKDLMILREYFFQKNSDNYKYYDIVSIREKYAKARNLTIYGKELK